MKTYITIPFRYLLGRKLRTFLTTLAVVFGVAVVFSVNMLLPTIQDAFNASEQGVTGQVDMTITSATGALFPTDLVDTVMQTSGVAAAAPAYQTQVNLPAGSKATSVTLIGLDPARAETVRFYQITDGRFLNAGDTLAAVVSQPLAQSAGLSAGDKFSLPTPGGLTEFNIVGVYSTRAGDQFLVPLQTAQDLYDASGKVSALDVVINAGADRDAVKDALQAKLGSAYNVGSSAATSALSTSFALGGTFFNLFGILTLFMGAFLIFNTFRTVVIERRRDIGLLRAVGATRGTITRLILIESAIQGVVGTVIGVALGYLLGLSLIEALTSLMSQFTNVKIGNVVVPLAAPILAITLGIGTTVLAGLLPALSAGRVPVLVALRQEPPAVTQRRISTGSWVGTGLIVLGIASLLVGNTTLALLGSVVILVGLVMLTPLLLRPISRVLEPVVRWLFSREGMLAEGNLQRNPGRSAVTVSALTIALAIFVALFAVFSSIQVAYTNRLLKSLGADILLLPQGLGVWNGDVGVSEEFEQQFAQIPGVGDWSGLSYAPAQVNGATIQMLGFDPVTYPKVGGVVFDHGDESAYAELANGRNAIVSGIMATSMGLSIGDTVPVQTPEGERDYRIVGVGADYLGVKLSTLYTSRQNMVADFGNPDDLVLFANLEQGADAAATRASIQELLQGYPQLTLNWGADWRVMELKILEQLFSVLSLIMVALIIPSLLGLINTLAINMLERTREIGVLRAIGATRGQIRRLVVAESLLLAMTGTAMGLLAGIALGYALVGVIGSTVYSTAFYFPWVGILFAVAIALIMALLASVLPARQAARVKIVQALQYE